MKQANKAATNKAANGNKPNGTKAKKQTGRTQPAAPPQMSPAELAKGSNVPVLLPSVAPMTDDKQGTAQMSGTLTGYGTAETSHVSGLRQGVIKVIQLDKHGNRCFSWERKAMFNGAFNPLQLAPKVAGEIGWLAEEVQTLRKKHGANHATYCKGFKVSQPFYLVASVDDLTFDTSAVVAFRLKAFAKGMPAPLELLTDNAAMCIRAAMRAAEVVAVG